MDIYFEILLWNTNWIEIKIRVTKPSEWNHGLKQKIMRTYSMTHSRRLSTKIQFFYILKAKKYVIWNKFKGVVRI